MELSVLPSDVLVTMLGGCANNVLYALWMHEGNREVLRVVFTLELFWKYRVESIFNATISEVFPQWKNIYHNIRRMRHCWERKLVKKRYTNEMYLLITYDYTLIYGSAEYALATASRSGCTDLVLLLLSTSTRLDPYSYEPYSYDCLIKEAITHRHQDTAMVLLRSFLPLDDELGEYLIMACRRGLLNVVKALIRDLNTPLALHGGVAICAAVASNHVGVVKMLLAFGVDPSCQGNYCYNHTVSWRYKKIKVLLLQDPRVRAQIPEYDLKYIQCDESGWFSVAKDYE